MSKAKNIQKLLDKAMEGRKYADDYDRDQIESYIELGLEYGSYDQVALYATPEYSIDQMQIFYFGLKDGVDISKYADPNIESGSMEEVYLALLDGSDISDYAKRGYDDLQLRQLRYGMENGDDHIDKWDKIRKGVFVAPLSFTM